MKRRWMIPWWLLSALLAPSCSNDSKDPQRALCASVCERLKCSPSALQSVDCWSACTYGGALIPGLAPSPYCADFDAQQRCVTAALEASCDQVFAAVVACPRCSVLTGAPCKTDDDCGKYIPGFRCDTRRAAGYCTRDCVNADSCSLFGPERCSTAPAPSFATGQSGSWCLLSCKEDTDCRVTDGYACVRKSGSGIGVCDIPP